jgi:hypothetical protein
MNIERDRANPDPDLHHFSVYQDPLNDEDHCNYDYGGSASKLNEDDNNEDGGNIDGSTVEAHVDLTKTPCRYRMTCCLSCQNILTYIYSIQSLPRRCCYRY